MKANLDTVLLGIAAVLLVIAWLAVIAVTGEMYWGFDQAERVATPQIHVDFDYSDKTQ